MILPGQQPLTIAAIAIIRLEVFIHGTASSATRDIDVEIGVGTYSDPLTFASAPGEFSSCEIIYLPYLKKYVRFEDYCAQCSMWSRPALSLMLPFL